MSRFAQMFGIAAMVLVSCTPAPTPSPSPTPSPKASRPPSPSPAPRPSPVAAGLVYALGFEAGPIDSQTAPGLQVTAPPSVVVEWQGAVARTGTGAYHMRGGNLRGDATIHNQGSTNPFGGLEVWAGGAFYFVSFPLAERPVWLIGTVPTDGVRGADDKPLAAVTSRGTLMLRGSNSRTSSELDVPLRTNRWYYIVVHGLNGIGKTQELFLYDGTSGELLGRTSVVLDVTGNFRNPVTKWGFGTSQDSTGLEYYLDDIYHAVGSANPGPLRVAAGQEVQPARAARGKG